MLDADPPVLRLAAFDPLESHFLQVASKRVGQALGLLDAEVALELQYGSSVAADGDLHVARRIAELT